MYTATDIITRRGIGGWDMKFEKNMKNTLLEERNIKGRPN